MGNTNCKKTKAPTKTVVAAAKGNECGKHCRQNIPRCIEYGTSDIHIEVFKDNVAKEDTEMMVL